MPLASYFRNVGAALLALIFLADFYFPKAAVEQKPAVHPPAIRIHSDRKWPERIVFDTSQAPVMLAEPVATNIAIAGLPAPVEPSPVQAEASTTRDAFALMPRADTRPPARVDQHKRQRKAQYRVARSNRYARPPAILAMRQQQFAWFGFPQWR